MRPLLRGWSLGVGVLVFALATLGSVALAAPPSPISAKYAQAAKLYASGDMAKALAVIEEGLALDGKKDQLLCLKGKIFQETVDYGGTLAAYKACLAAGAEGPLARTANSIIKVYVDAETTFLDITVANGPATIYLDTKTKGPLCAPTSVCNKGVLAKSYRVIAERNGFERWSGNVTAVRGTHVKVDISLVEKPSPLTVRVAQAGASIAIDGAPYDPKAKIAAGKHRVVVTLDGHAEEQREIVAHEGLPVELDVSLTPTLAITVTPPEAKVTFDGKPAVIVNGRIAVPAGEHTVAGQAAGYEPRTVVIPADRPADHPISLVLSAVVVPPPRPPSPRRKIAVGVAGLGVVAAGAGIVLGLQSKSLEDDAFKKCASPTTPCADAREANDLNKRGRDRALQANIAYGVAAGAAVTAVVLWFTGGPESPEPRVAVTPRLPLQQGAAAGLDIALRF